MNRDVEGRGLTGFVVVLAASWLLATASASGQTAPSSGEPLPLDVAVSLRTPNTRSAFDLSPDGKWIAPTVETDETIPRDTHRYAATGFPFAEGDSRMEATLWNTTSGERILLGGERSASWAPVWSP